ncbi:CNP1-like family protein [Variovorax sp. VNK109]|jgi:hypothetical protein|uniref:CNP1-like family protein n=1 Tax=Variovorax sp. VNK109 TaxID=3400919 RepID=UPI003C11BACA
MKPTTIETASRSLLTLALAAFGMSASFAQLNENPDWKEESAPQPPAFKTDGLIKVDMPNYLELSYGVDPQTLTIGKDSVVRYVMVATSRSGTVNAMHEAIRCSTGEVKLYARYGSSGWLTDEKQEWRPMQSAARHSWAAARQGICNGRAPQRTPQDIVRAMRSTMMPAI